MAVLVGLLTGFLMCIPIGPINVWVIQTVIKKNTTSALALALGGSIMDAFYFYAILTGLSFIQISDDWSARFKFAGAFVIIFLGLKELYMSKKAGLSIKTVEYRPGWQGLSGFFFLGVILYTSNPTLMITMSALGAFIKSLQLFSFTQLNIISLSLALGLGSFFWFVALSLFVKKYEQQIRDHYMRRFSLVSGLLMLALGVFLLTKF